MLCVSPLCEPDTDRTINPTDGQEGPPSKQFCVAEKVFSSHDVICRAIALLEIEHKKHFDRSRSICAPNTKEMT